MIITLKLFFFQFVLQHQLFKYIFFFLSFWFRRSNCNGCRLKTLPNTIRYFWWATTSQNNRFFAKEAYLILIWANEFSFSWHSHIDCWMTVVCSVERTEKCIPKSNSKIFAKHNFVPHSICFHWPLRFNVEDSEIWLDKLFFCSFLFIYLFCTYHHWRFQMMILNFQFWWMRKD